MSTNKEVKLENVDEAEVDNLKILDFGDEKLDWTETFPSEMEIE